jgi:hypothetical protein
LDFNKLWSKIDHFMAVVWWLVQVNKTMYGQWDFYFVYSEATKFTNWDEFTDIFTSQTVFLSNYEKSYKNIVEKDGLQNTLDIKKISNMDDVVSYVDDFLVKDKNKICFIISTIKSESKDLFEKMYNRWIDQKAIMLIENITGSLWKNIFKAKSGWSKVIVGGYNFMMRLLSNKIPIDICIDFNIKWKMSEYLLYDIQWYAQYNKE